MKNLVDFKQNYYLLRLDYKYDFLSSEKKKLLINNFLKIDELNTVIEDEEENSITITDKSNLLIEEKRMVEIKKDGIYFGTISYCTYNEWLKFRKECINCYINTLKIESTDNFRVIQLRYVIHIPLKNLKKDYLPLIFPTNSLISNLRDAPYTELTDASVNIANKTKAKRLYISIDLEDKIGNVEYLEVKISLSLFQIPKGCNLKETIKKNIENFDNSFDIINNKFLMKLISK